MILNGPEVKPKNGAKAQKLVLLLHGYGSDGNNLIDLADQFARVLPCAHFISPNAIMPFEVDGYDGYQWFSLANRDEDFLYNGIKKAATIFNNYIDEQLSRFALSEEQLILVGFSQGAMMSLHVAPRRSKAIAGVVAFSGALVGGVHLQSDLNSRPKTILIHGTEDEVVNHSSLRLADNILQQNKIPVTTYSCKGLNHTISSEGVSQANEFFSKLF